MREMLFRVYDKVEKKHRKLDGLHDTITIDGDGKASYYNLQNGAGGDECILEQFTGLLDRHKKEAFDGDIVRLFIDGIEVGVNAIHFRYGAFRVLDRYLCGFPDFEIIGNIHDNPELLEATHD